MKQKRRRMHEIGFMNKTKMIQLGNYLNQKAAFF